MVLSSLAWYNSTKIQRIVGVLAPKNLKSWSIGIEVFPNLGAEKEEANESTAQEGAFDKTNLLPAFVSSSLSAEEAFIFWCFTFFSETSVFLNRPKASQRGILSHVGVCLKSSRNGALEVENTSCGCGVAHSKLHFFYRRLALYSFSSSSISSCGDAQILLGNSLT